MGRTTKADYARHYAKYQGTPEQVAKRSERNKARRVMEAKLGPAAIKGKDIDHKKPLRSGGGNAPGNLRAISPSRNRSWKDGV